MMKTPRKHLFFSKATKSILMHALPVLIMTGAYGCGGGDKATAETSPEQAEKPRNVRILTLSPRDLAEYFTISGVTTPVRGTMVSAEEGGIVAEITRDKGAVAAEDEILVLLDREMLAAQLESAEAARELSAYNEDRTRRLYDANSVSRIEMLQAETALKQAGAQEKIARLRYERAAVKAPFDGVVTGMFVEKGQLVSPGMPIARIADPYTLRLEGTVSEAEIAWVKEGEPAVVTFDGFGETVDGVVDWTGFEADPATGKFGVEILVSNPDLAIRPGVVARARVRKALHRDVLVIPRDAVLQESGRNTVYVAVDGLAHARDITLGPGRGLLVAVSEGLRAGDRLIVRGHRDLKDGCAVFVREEADFPDGTATGDPGNPGSAAPRASTPDSHVEQSLELGT